MCWSPGGGSGAPRKVRQVPGQGHYGLLAPSMGKPAGATDGKLGAFGFYPRVGAEAPSDGVYLVLC